MPNVVADSSSLRIADSETPLSIKYFFIASASVVCSHLIGTIQLGGNLPQTKNVSASRYIDIASSNLDFSIGFTNPSWVKEKPKIIISRFDIQASSISNNNNSHEFPLYHNKIAVLSISPIVITIYSFFLITRFSLCFICFKWYYK